MKALILVDLQNDFAAGGALPVPGARELIPLLNQLQTHFDLIVATQDWHPRQHGSFAANHPGRQIGERILLGGLPQILWPVHCVEHTHGTAFLPGLNKERWTAIFRKGQNAEIDSYSGFFDNGGHHPTGLGNFLHDHGAREIFIAGLATDYCVKFTALDAVALGFEVTVLIDACRGVNLHPGDVAQAVAEMQQAGVATLYSKLLFNPITNP